jgi:hypothetical protein
VVDGSRGVPQPFTPLRQPQNGPFSPKDCFLGYSGCSDKGRFSNLESLPPPWIGLHEWPRAKAARGYEDNNLWRVRNIRRDRDVETNARRGSTFIPGRHCASSCPPWRMLPSRRPQGLIWDGHIGQRYTRAAGQHCRWSRVLTWRAPRKSNRLIYVPRLLEGQARAVSSQAHAHWCSQFHRECGSPRPSVSFFNHSSPRNQATIRGHRHQIVLGVSAK